MKKTGENDSSPQESELQLHQQQQQQLEQQPSGEQYEGTSKTVDCVSLAPVGVSSKECQEDFTFMRLIALLNPEVPNLPI